MWSTWKSFPIFSARMKHIRKICTVTVDCADLMRTIVPLSMPLTARCLTTLTASFESVPRPPTAHPCSGFPIITSKPTWLEGIAHMAVVRCTNFSAQPEGLCRAALGTFHPNLNSNIAPVNEQTKARVELASFTRVLFKISNSNTQNTQWYFWYIHNLFTKGGNAGTLVENG